MKKTFVINFISGPSSGKTTLSALLFAKLKLKKKYSVEYVQEYAKHLVWTKQFDILNNQYYVTQYQYKLLKQMNGVVDFIITDGPLIQGMYYNMHNRDNISNVEKTEKYIVDCHSEFNNINIFLSRGNYEYETQGRLQNEEEAKEIDVILKHLLKQKHIDFIIFDANADDTNINKIIEYIEKVVENDNL
ncbi:AAA domain protein [Indivirus ILV1]|uniref:AAA domain protein n=1 Tax=Indivirus ILV1 TaxID=1977633 RepID=A0A1V0SE31_9VIRU|nr:AAA domain protein [Indivirus ILV1]